MSQQNIQEATQAYHARADHAKLKSQENARHTLQARNRREIETLKQEGILKRYTRSERYKKVCALLAASKKEIVITRRVEDFEVVSNVTTYSLTDKGLTEKRWWSRIRFDDRPDERTEIFTTSPRKIITCIIENEDVEITKAAKFARDKINTAVKAIIASAPE